MTATPERSLEQRRDALEYANHIRSFRAALKRSIKERQIKASVVLVDPPEEVETMRAYDLLLSMPHVGPKKASRWLYQARASHSKTIGGLSERQRCELLAMVEIQERTFGRFSRQAEPMQRAA
jgi:hypothetical protein